MVRIKESQKTFSLQIKKKSSTCAMFLTPSLQFVRNFFTIKVYIVSIYSRAFEHSFLSSFVPFIQTNVLLYSICCLQETFQLVIVTKRDEIMDIKITQASSGVCRFSCQSSVIISTVVVYLGKYMVMLTTMYRNAIQS